MASITEPSILLESDLQGRIVLPKGVRGDKRQTYYCRADDDGTITLVPVVGVITADQAYFWTNRWQTGEREALRDIQDGKVKKITPRGLKKYLDDL